ncbi:MAG TPA: universal stress protein [Planctomycetota bacterium]|nr:universal stress protein [Planctomycetota bacterium]
MSEQALRVLVPLDGSDEAESVFPLLDALAHFRPIRLTLLRVVAADEPTASASRYLGSLLEWLRRRNLPSETKCEWGRPAREILWLGKGVRFDLIAMSTHGRTGLRRTLMGSVTEEVLRHAEIPLLINRPGTRPGSWEQILACLDGSKLAEQILPDAQRLARMTGGHLHLIQAARPATLVGAEEGGVYLPAENPLPYLRSVCERLEAPGIPASPVVKEGPPAAVICRSAEEVGAGLIMMATHGRTGLGRFFLGSTAEEVLRHSPCPVYVRRTVAMPVESGTPVARV